MCNFKIITRVLGMGMLLGSAVALAQPIMYNEDQYIDMMNRVLTAQGRPLTPEQEQIYRAKYREKIGIAPAPTSMPQQAVQQLAAETEDSINAKIQAFPAKTTDLTIEGQKDGFLVNGQPYVDPEGRITNFAYDVLSGDVTYMMQSTPSSYIIKYVKAGSNQDGLVIGTATQGMNGWQVQTVTGKRLNGELITMQPKGMLISRDSAAFRYTPGVGIKNIVVPQGYIVAPMQHGNVGSTNHILLEKNEPPKTALSSAFDFRAIGSMLGVSKKEDYALMNTENGKLTLLNISTEDNDVTSYSDCKKRNNLVNDCAKMTTEAALYKKDGSKNIFHYYWRTNWFNTQAGPVLVAEESGIRDITITDLTTGKKVIAFSRTAGIADFAATQQPDGKIKIAAKLAFELKTIDDAVAYLQATPDVPPPAPDKQVDKQAAQ